jgi:hypothetical protein
MVSAKSSACDSPSLAWFQGLRLYRSKTLRKACDLWFGRLSELRQDRGSCLSVCCT